MHLPSRHPFNAPPMMSGSIPPFPVVPPRPAAPLPLHPAVFHPAVFLPAVLLAVVLASAPVSAQQAWTRVPSLCGADVHAFAASGDTVLASTFTSGVFRSIDGGETWSHLPGSPTAVDETLLLDGSYIELRTVSRWMRSTDYGVTWAAMQIGNSTFPEAIAAEGPRRLAAFWNDGVYASTDRGTTWKRVLTTAGSVETMHIHGATLIVSASDGLRVSRDDGASWRTVHEMPDRAYWISRVGDTIVAVHWGLMVVSTDAGESWSARTVKIGGRSPSADAIALTPGGLLITSTDNGCQRSTDLGRTWERIGPGFGADLRSLLPYRGSVLLGITGAGVLRSDDVGATWRHSARGMPSPTVRALASGGAALYAAVPGAGILRSDNEGGTWTQLPAPLAHRDIHAIAVTPTLLLAGDKLGKLFRSSDAGVSWDTVYSSPPSQIFDACVEISQHGGTWYAVHIASGAVRSTDDGTTWTRVNDGIPSGRIHSRIVSVDGMFARSTRDGVYRSTDGTQWTRSVTGLTDTMVTDLALCGSTLVCVTVRNQIWLSDDYGLSWRMQQRGPVYPVTNLYSAWDVLCALNFTYPYGAASISRCGGSWSLLTPDPLAEAAPRALHIRGGTIFVGTLYDGLWKRALSSVVTVETPQHDAHHPPSATLELDASPQPFGDELRVRFRAPSGDAWRLTVHDMLGRELAELDAGSHAAGALSAPPASSIRHARWRPGTEPSGVYFLRLSSPAVRRVVPVILRR